MNFRIIITTEKYFIVNIYFELDGRVKEVWFRLKEDTKITPQEISIIEKNLKTLQVKLANQDWGCVGKVNYYLSNRVFRFK